MSKLPQCSGEECAKALGHIEFYFVRQKGSHMVYRRDEPFAQTVIPNHKELSAGTLRRIIRDAGLTVAEFVELLNQ